MRFRNFYYALAAVVTFSGPAAFLVFYRRAFDYRADVVWFGELASLFVFTAAVTLFVSASWLAPRWSTVFRWCAAVCAGAFAAMQALIYIGNYFSNAYWGNTLNFGIVYANLSLAPLNALQFSRTSTLIFLAAFCLALFVTVAGAAVFTGTTISSLVAVLHMWPARQPARIIRRRLFVVAPLAFCLFMTGGILERMRSHHSAQLQGEPLTAFFSVLPTVKLSNLDPMRRDAAFSDKKSLTEYKIPAKFDAKNVILIFADSLRADRMGVYGYKRQTTPFLSGLMKQGLLHRVDMALSTCSASSCGIASTLSSHPYHESSPFNLKLHTLLHMAGYRTRFYLSGEHRSWGHLYEIYGARDIDELHDWKSLHVRNANDDRNILKALENVEPASGRPNFFYFFLMCSHAIGVKLPEYEVFKPAESDSVRLLTFWNKALGSPNDGSRKEDVSRELEIIANRYDNGIVQADANIARIFKILDEKGYLQNSIVVILGDHGEGLGEHTTFGHGYFLYQENIHIPLLIYDREPSRYRNGSFATQLDIAPTILDRLGLPVPSSWRGRSLLLPPPQESITVHQTYLVSSPCLAAVRKTDSVFLKYLHCRKGKRWTAEELYDLRQDPSETNNIAAAADPAVIAPLRQLVDRISTAGINWRE